MWIEIFKVFQYVCLHFKDKIKEMGVQRGGWKISGESDERKNDIEKTDKYI